MLHLGGEFSLGGVPPKQNLRTDSSYPKEECASEIENLLLRYMHTDRVHPECVHTVLAVVRQRHLAMHTPTCADQSECGILLLPSTIWCASKIPGCTH